MKKYKIIYETFLRLTINPFTNHLRSLNSPPFPLLKSETRWKYPITRVQHSTVCRSSSFKIISFRILAKKNKSKFYKLLLHIYSLCLFCK